MNISIICNDAACYSTIKSSGFCGIDFSFPNAPDCKDVLTQEYYDSVLEKHQLLKENGLYVAQTHLSIMPAHIEPLGDGTYQSFEEYMLPILLKEIELTAKMNCRTAVIHLYFENDKEKSRAGNIQLISKLLPTLEKHNVILSIENIFGPRLSDAHLSSAEDLLFYIDYFKSENLGICLDTGHAVVLKQNPTEMLKKIGANLTALHIHTTVLPDDMHLIPNTVHWEEKIDWDEFSQELLRTQYGGTFNLEVKLPKKLKGNAVTAFYQLAYAVAKEIICN